MKIYGKNVALEKLNSNNKIHKIYISDKFNDQKILSLIKSKQIPTKIVNNRDLDKMCKGLHQGIILEVDDVKTYDLKETLKAKKEKEAKNAKESLVVDKIIEGAQMDIPEPMINTQKEQMLNEFAQQLSYQGLSIDQYFQFSGMTKEKFLETAEPEAIRRIKSRLVLEAVAKAENIEVSDDDLNAELEKMAETYQMEPDKLKDMVGDEEKKAIRLDIAVQKAVDLVRDAAVEK